MSRRRSRRMYLAATVFLGLVLSGLSSLLVKPVEGWATHHVLGIAIATIVVLITMMAWTAWEGPGDDRDFPPLPEQDPLDRAMVRLAEAVEKQWVGEAGHRNLATGERRLAISLAPTRRSVVGGDTQPLLGRLDSVDAVINAFEGIPSRRCVILGVPGSGKTSAAVLLTLELVRRWLQTRVAGQRMGPVPVFMSLPGWNPQGTDPLTTGLMGWMEGRLANEYPFLRDSAQYGTDAPGELLRTGRVRPILDGLDEIAMLDTAGGIDAVATSELQAEAIRQIAEVCHYWSRLGLTEPVGLVLTCRAAEYEAAMELAREQIPDAAVMELEPITLQTAVAFLRQHSTPAQLAEWKRVLAVLERGHADALARAFSTPLAVDLARDVYSASDRHPSELLSLADGTTGDVNKVADAIVRKLLEASVEHAFPEQGGRWRGAQARLWLGFLARRMRDHGDRYDIRWWELPALLGRIHGIIAAITGFAIIVPPVGLGFGVVLNKIGGLTLGVAVGAVAGVANGLALGWTSARHQPPPTELYFGKENRRLRTVLRSGTVVGFVGGVVGLIIFRSPLGALAGVAIGLPIAIAYGGATIDASARVAEPRRLLHNDILVSVVFALAYGGPIGLVVSLAVNPVVGLLLGIATALSGGLTYGLPWLISLKAHKVGIIAWVHLVLAILLSRGRLPWRLIPFLEEAHARGVLRQVGPAYQFRHVYLRDVLAGAPGLP